MAWEQLPLWARRQIIEKKIRVFTLPGFQIARKATDRADLQLRMQGNAFLGAFFRVSPLLKEFQITPRAVSRSRSQAVRKKVRPLGQRSGEIEHGSHDPGLRAGARASCGRDERARSLESARCCAAAVVQRRRRRLRYRMPLLPCSRRAIRAHLCNSNRDIRRPVPCRSRLQPTVKCLRVRRRHGRRHRRYLLEICRPPRDSTLHRRKLHPVHGVHRGVS